MRAESQVTEESDLTIILLEGLGDPNEPGCLEYTYKNDGKVVSINGTTQIRAG